MIRADGLCGRYFYDIAQMLATMCIELVHFMPLATSFAFEPRRNWQGVEKSHRDEQSSALEFDYLKPHWRCAR